MPTCDNGGQSALKSLRERARSAPDMQLRGRDLEVVLARLEAFDEIERALREALPALIADSKSRTAADQGDAEILLGIKALFVSLDTHAKGLEARVDEIERRLGVGGGAVLETLALFNGRLEVTEEQWAAFRRLFAEFFEQCVEQDALPDLPGDEDLDEGPPDPPTEH